MARPVVNLPAAVPGLASLPTPSVPGAYWASVNTARVLSGSLSMPLYGAWVADVSVDTDVPITSPVSVVIGNLTLAGTVYRQANFAGRTEARIVAGGGGWSKSVQARGYNQPGAGVLKSQVLNDAALEVGEKVLVTVDGPAGDQYVRMGDSPSMPGKAGRVLRSLAGQQWWIDNVGVTHVGPRVQSLVASDFQVESFRGASGSLRIATEDPASWMPGNTFASATVATQTIASVRHEFREDGIARLEVMVSGALGGNDRWAEDIREMIRQELAASLPYAQVYEYLVVGGIPGQTIDALPVDPTRGAPPVTGYNISGGGAISAYLGQHVAIGFLDGNPGKPFLVETLGALDSFIRNFVHWTPTGVLGDGPALKALITAWIAQVGYLPPI